MELKNDQYSPFYIKDVDTSQYPPLYEPQLNRIANALEEIRDALQVITRKYKVHPTK